MLYLPAKLNNLILQSTFKNLSKVHKAGVKIMTLKQFANSCRVSPLS
jgi:hypothetical protein